MHTELFYFILIVLSFGFILERFLDYLNSKTWTDRLPMELQDVYDPDEYKKSQLYKKENDRFSLLTANFSFLVVLSVLLFDGFAWVDGISRNLISNPILISLVFFAILFFASEIINTPFAIYDTFVIEQKYGFNKTTPRTFIFDKLKSWLLTVIIGGGVLFLIVWFYLQTKEMFWIYTWIASVAFMIFMMMFYSNLIVPLFNKQVPLEDGELRDSIEKFSSRAGFKLTNIYVIDGSKRSTKANAYFTGLGPKKRIVLYDTLIKDLTINEIVAVLAHEVGHYKKKHTLWGLLVSILDTGLTLFILSLFIASPALSLSLGSQVPGFHLAVIAFGILYSPVSLIIGLGSNILSRKNEYAADKYAASFGMAEDLISALKKLSRKSLSNLTPHPAYTFFHYSHPTLLQRILALKTVTS
jgi:STE24 endopeptidase